MHPTLTVSPCDTHPTKSHSKVFLKAASSAARTLQCTVGWAFIYNLTFGTAFREKGESVELDKRYFPVQI